MDDVLREAMEPVLRDLRGIGLTPDRIEDDNWTGDPKMPSVTIWSVDGSGTGIYVVRSAPECDRIAAVADQVQEWAIEELWGEASTNWPPCPQHPDGHPLTATTRDGAAVWECPSDRTVGSSIGAL